jgi:HAD superfamily hydrolase (TIGR01484 family)
MRYLALACDYDGTMAHHGRVAEETLAALERLRATGRRLVLVTGRVLDELRPLFPDVGMFEWVVAENGARPFEGDARAYSPCCSASGAKPRRSVFSVIVRGSTNWSK